MRRYEALRAAYVPEVVQLKRRRRVCLRDVTVVFECRETVLFQVHEVLRLEPSLSAARVRAEFDEYAPLVLDQGKLTATLLIDGGPAAWGQRLAEAIAGRRGTVSLAVGGAQHLARPIGAPSVLGAVHYLEFAADRSTLRRSPMRRRASSSASSSTGAA
jgi:hypothetical protein